MSEQKESPRHKVRRVSRRSFIAGAGLGAAGMWAASRGLERLGDDPARPPELYEYFVDNFWFKSAGLENQAINAPLKGHHQADIVIIGGGFTGLASAYHLSELMPGKKIVLLEGACCGYGASGRNGGFCDPGLPGLMEYAASAGLEAGRRAFEASTFGIAQIKQMISEHGLSCDFEENGMIEAAITEEQAASLEEEQKVYSGLGIKSTMFTGNALKEAINSPRYIAALAIPNGAILNPAKLARGMKPIVENRGVEVRERTVVLRVHPGKIHRIETEMGDITAPALVLGLDGYAPGLGFFRNHVMPMSSYVIATEPLSPAQWQSIGWSKRWGLSDIRLLFDYLRPTVDGRIVIGGSDYPCYAHDALSSGNNKPVIELLTQSLFTTFPQLEGLRIDHAWGGTMGISRDYTPSVGVMGEYKNIYYGVAYNGEGVAFAQIAGRIIAELMSGEHSALTELFVVNHPIPYMGPENLRFLLSEAYKTFLKWTNGKKVK
ncbi:MAG TPA: FAD-binding oxidoreductase [Candidatus Hydrogenedentes bacterium]|nr:FAD-binding oxidoreductase [Candidatus Hydrogenedentota bacterium]